MPKVELTNEQVMELVKQLPPDQQEALFRMLLTQQWAAWEQLSRYGDERARQAAAARGRVWDAISEGEREAFVEDLVREDRKCAG